MNAGRTTLGRRLYVTGLFAVCLLSGVYAALWCSLHAFPFLDLPNHLARAFVISDLIFNSESVWKGVFEFHFRPDPYILGDLIVAGLFRLFGYERGGSAWVLLVFFSMPLAAAVHARVHRFPAHNAFVVVLIGMFLGTNWMFMSGFFSYQLGMAIMIVTLAIWHKVFQRPLYSFIVITTGAVLAYLTHYSAFVFLAIAVGVVCGIAFLKRELQLVTATAALLPVAVVALWHTMGDLAPMVGPAAIPAIWRTPVGKVLGLASPFVRYSVVVDAVLLATFVVLCGFALRRVTFGRTWWASESLGVGITFLAVYVVLPLAAGGVHDVDNRALIPAAFYLSLWAIEQLGAPSPVVLALAIVLAGGNAAYIWSRIGAHDSRIVHLREVMNHVPAKSLVLPICTLPNEGRIETLAHAGDELVPRRTAVSPYIYASSSIFMMRYFAYVHPPYAPHTYWYVRNTSSVNWSRVAKLYDYMLITRPFDASKIGVPYSLVFENAAGALLKVKSSSEPSSVPARADTSSAPKVSARVRHSPQWRPRYQPLDHAMPERSE